MSFTISDKATRVMRFLIGLRNPNIASALAGYGFTDDDLAEGWSLVNALGKGKLAFLPFTRDRDVLLKLDAWENHWFPISAACLERRFPAVFARMFMNLQQAEGPEVAVTVRTYVDRYDELTAPDSKYGPEGAKARDALTARGVTPAVVDEARNLLAQLTKVAAPPEVQSSIAEQEADLEKAQAALWAWYLEWSKVARVAIKQRALLHELGFLARRAAEEDPVPPAPGPEPVPVPAPPAPPVVVAAAH
jgi:hypothetical protein